MNTNGFQKTVRAKQAPGVPGEFRDSSVKRVLPYELGEDSSIGNPAYLIKSSGKATDTFASGTADQFLGIFVGPKEYTTNDRDLNATMVMRASAGQAAQVANLGHVWVKVAAPVAAGDGAYFGQSGWVGSAPTAGTAINANKLGVFISGGATGEVACVEING